MPAVFAKRVPALLDIQRVKEIWSPPRCPEPFTVAYIIPRLTSQPSIRLLQPSVSPRAFAPESPSPSAWQSQTRAPVGRAVPAL